MDIIKDKEKILFNHYLMQKENLQRMKGELPKGQFYLTLGTIANDLDLSLSKVRTLIKTFETLSIITSIQKGKPPKTPSIYSYNSIFNNNTLHDILDNTLNRTIESSDNETFTSTDNTLNHISVNMLNSNSKKELLKRNTKKNLFVENSNEMMLSKLLFSLMQNNNPNVRKPDFQRWSKEFDSILRIDKRNVEEVKKVIGWSQRDLFWKSNILSPSKLRKQYDSLVLKMKNDKLNKNNIIPLHNRDWEKEENRHYKY
ncbi:MAG: hypothetical protein Q4B63_10710 [Clostridium perfringens]|nr:hypothetical protein [Clostridium perfringens]